MVYFRLTGQSPHLQLKLENPIHLEDDVRYYLALTGFSCDNYFYNINEHISITFLNDKEIGVTFNIFPPYFISLENLHKEIRDFLVNKSLVASADEVQNFKLYRTRTSRVVIKSPIKCHINNGLRRFLGFTELQNNVEEYKTEYLSDNVASMYKEVSISQIRPFRTIEVHCDLVEHSYINHTEQWHKHDNSSLLYHLSPREHGDRVYEKPSVLNYITLKPNTLTIREINIYLTDENQVPLSNQLSDYIIYLKLVDETELNMN